MVERYQHRRAHNFDRALSLNPVHVLLAAGENTGLSVISVALLNQIRAVDRPRFLRRLGAIDEQTLERIDEAIKISLGLIRF